MTTTERFLKLTEYTTPFGNEHLLRQYLPDSLKTDEFGNYYVKIGDSRNMFVCHMDNVTRKAEKVNQILEGDFVKTDETTILGGDNKAGVCVLSHMIDNNVPGLYYFFKGEEGTAPEGGLWGSKRALKAYNDKFKNYDTCVAFDRKKYGSIISRQIATNCCSNEFVNSITEEFSKHDLEYKKDSCGYYTDSAVFMWVIPECTNLSVGVFGEHTKKESQDLKYLAKVADVATKVEWSKLVIKRDITNQPNYNERVIPTKNISDYNYFNKLKNKVFIKIFNKVVMLLDDFHCINIDNFQPGIKMVFSDWFNEEIERINIVIDYDENIWFNDTKIGKFEVFKKYYIKKYNYNILQSLDVDDFYDAVVNWYDKNYNDVIHYDKLNDRFVISFDELKPILEDELFVDFQDFLDYKDEFDNRKRFSWVEIDKSKKLVYMYDNAGN